MLIICVNFLVSSLADYWMGATVSCFVDVPEPYLRGSTHTSECQLPLDTQAVMQGLPGVLPRCCQVPHPCPAAQEAQSSSILCLFSLGSWTSGRVLSRCVGPSPSFWDPHT